MSPFTHTYGILGISITVCIGGRTCHIPPFALCLISPFQRPTGGASNRRRSSGSHLTDKLAGPSDVYNINGHSVRNGLRRAASPERKFCAPQPGDVPATLAVPYAEHAREPRGGVSVSQSTFGNSYQQGLLCAVLEKHLDSLGVPIACCRL